MENLKISAIDSGIVIVMVAIMFFSGYLKKYTKSNVLDYILMGRKLTLPLFIMTLVSSWYGGILAVTEISFNYGLYNFFTQGFFWYIAYLVFALFYVRKIRQTSATTLPDLIEKTIGKKSAKISSFFNIVGLLPIVYIIGLKTLLEILVPEYAFLLLCCALIFIIFYTYRNGLRGVVRSDAVQFIVMFFAVISVIVFSYLTWGGFSYLQEKLPESYFSFSGGNSILMIMVWGFIALATVVDPNFYHRTLAAADEKTAKRGVLYSILFWLVFDMCTTLGGMYAKALLPEAPARTAYLYYALEVLPWGYSGVFISGILATLLSTLDSFLFLASLTAAQSFTIKKGQNIKSRYLFFAIFFTALSLLVACFYQGKIEFIWYTIGTFCSAALLIPISVVLLLKVKIYDKCFACATIVSTAVMLFIMLGGCKPLQNYEFYIGLLVSLCILFFNRYFKNDSLSS